MPSSKLLFQWIIRERRGYTLAFFALAGVLFMTAFALLFQVVYPAARRQPLSAQRILLLDRSSPAARPILDAVSDRDFLLLHGSIPSATQLTTHAPVFTPSFKGFDFAPRDFIASSAAASTLPRLFRADHPLLPPLTKSKPNSQVMPKGKPQSLQPVVVEGLSNRPVVRPIALSNAAHAQAEGTSYRIAVDARGRVTFVIPIEDAAALPETFAAFQALRDQLEQLRFAPTDSQSLQWGTVTLRWRGAKSDSP